jgi:hypothetical protein
MEKETINPESFEKKTNIVSVTKKIQAEVVKLDQETAKVKSEELKILKEIDVLNQKLSIDRLEAKSKAVSEKNSSVLCKMMILSDIMTSTYSQDSNLGVNKLFSDDELYPYKAKMLELLKKL